MVNRKLSSAVMLALVMGLFVVGAVSAQTGPVTYTVPSIDAEAVIESSFGWLTGGIIAILVTMAAIRLAPKVISAARRAFGAASR